MKYPRSSFGRINNPHLAAAIYYAAFFIFQLAVTLSAMLPTAWYDGTSSTWLMTGVQIVSNLLVVLLFLSLRWAVVSNRYLLTRPWDVFLWAAVMALGTIIPSEALNDALGVEMPEEVAKVFMNIARSPLGYLCIGIIGPLTEELVFRGAILRVLLPKGQLMAIVLSSLLFALAHGNMAQMPHAFLSGLLLGWMYARTGSILPGFVVHLVNNTVAFLLLRLAPDNPDARLVDLLQGDYMQVLLYVGFSLLVFLPALWQLHLRMKKAGD